MSVNISFDPFAGSRQEDQQRHDIYLRDSDIRRRQFELEWNQRNIEKEWQRQDTRLQTLAKDADEAGISLLAALGTPGQTPATFPIASGAPTIGRVGGRQSTFGISVDFQADLMDLAFRKAKAETESAEIQTGMEAVAANKALKGEAYPADIPVANEGTISPGKTSMTTTYRDRAGNEFKGPSQNFPDIDQWFLWGLMNIINQAQIKQDHPYQPGLDRRTRGNDWKNTQEDISP